MSQPAHVIPELPWIVRLSALQRLAIAVPIAVVASLLLVPWFSARTLLLTSWNIGALCYLGMAWMVVARTDETLTRMRAQRYDPSGRVIFLLIVTAASAGIVAIGFMVGDIKQLSFWPRVERLTLSVAALLVSWLLIHTVFAFHYAHLYYWQPEGQESHHGGLRFPDDDDPDYLDFAYYAFVVGMTSQVSDVVVLSRPMRRLTLIHGVLSFIYNIAVLAMSIGIIGGAL
ncbi:MAG TPA: DUF1345 domain-containing protein [Casimicrobiaceae bacterium]|nr:DUF1345 domain-containing protein [Casimicrobiaceae bacterium]